MRNQVRHLDGKWYRVAPRTRYYEPVPEVMPDFGFDVDAVRTVIRRHMRHTGTAPTLDTLRSFGFTKIGSGAYKVAYIHDRWVVKAPRYATGWREVYVEREFYRRLDETERWFLPKSYWLDRFVVVQERLNPNPDVLRGFLSQTVNFIGNRIGLGDLHEYNIGFGEGGRWAIIDFSPSSYLKSPAATAAWQEVSRPRSKSWERPRVPRGAPWERGYA